MTAQGVQDGGVRASTATPHAGRACRVVAWFQALDRRGSVISTMPGDVRCGPGLAADAGSRGHRPHVLPLRDALKSRGHGFTGWPMKDPCGSKLPQRRPHSHGPRRRRERGIYRGLPLNVARFSPTRRRPTRRAEAPHAENRKYGEASLMHPRSFAPVFPVETTGQACIH
jgi:hypothetical protein